MIKPHSCQYPETIVKLWVHEACRTFADRLIDVKDISWLKYDIKHLKEQFKTTIE